MKSFSVCLVLALACVSVLADDYDKCKGDFKSFIDCVKSGYSKISDADKQKYKDQKKSKADQCFKAAGCDAPDWDADPMGGKGKGGKGGMGGMGDMPQVVKDCLKRKMMDKIGAKLQPCLSKKGIKNFNFSALAEMVSGSGGEGFGMDDHGGAGGKGGFAGAMKSKFNAVKGVDKCAQKQGGPSATPIKNLEVCLQGLKKDDKDRMCTLTKPCMSKVTTGDCKKRGEDLVKALCQCKKEKEAEIAKKLQSIGQNQQKVSIQDLARTVADDQEVGDMLQQVDQCYKSNNVEEPKMLQLAIQMFGSGGSGGAGAVLGNAFAINGSTVVIMGDMMSLDAADSSECDACP
jgi:hypothetical protein